MINSRTKLNPNLNYFLSTLSKKKPYVKVLKDKIQTMLSMKRSEYREVNLRILKRNFDVLPDYDMYDLSKMDEIDESIVVAYVVDITKTRSNFYLNILNSVGKLMLTASAGNLIDLSVIKRKSAGFLLINAIFKLIPKQKYLKGKPIALHIKNKRIPIKFIRKLQRKSLLKCITVFHKKPFNGCRSKKIRSV
jgi:hypothetical protein